MERRQHDDLGQEAPEMPAPASSHWVIDKRIPVALLVTFALQTACAVWWVSALSQRVSALEEKQATSSTLPERTAVLESQAFAMRAALDRIDNKLDKVIDRLSGPGVK